MITRKHQDVKLDTAFFPVEMQPIFLDNGTRPPKRISGYKAIVKTNDGTTISVVSDKYRLLTNQEAYNLADYVIRGIFEGKTLGDFECFNVRMPKSSASCKIDLIIPNNFSKLSGDLSESWVPFLRITNSYNKTKPLKYEVGFCRWICLNGLIFGQKGVSFALSHSERIGTLEIMALAETARRQIGSVDSLWKVFEQKMITLRQIPLPPTSALPIYCKAFGIHVKQDISEIQKEIYSNRASQIVKASQEYFKELGNNAYAMMNVLSDFASFPEWTQSPNNYVDGYQRKVGKWVDEFIAEYKKDGFSLSKYIGEECQNTAYFLESLIPQE